ncbi:unnamed protein product [Closterium sp. Yama58-4]|nr:unnamed protein product [Closterium sp. Yama58-4]
MKRRNGSDRGRGNPRAAGDGRAAPASANPSLALTVSPSYFPSQDSWCNSTGAGLPEVSSVSGSGGGGRGAEQGGGQQQQQHGRAAAVDHLRGEGRRGGKGASSNKLWLCNELHGESFMLQATKEAP